LLIRTALGLLLFCAAAPAANTSVHQSGRVTPQQPAKIATDDTLLKNAQAATATEKPGFPKIVNVRDYGAVGDGATADDAAITNAVAALTNRAILYFPASAGCYVVNTASPFTIAATPFVIMGDGKLLSSICKIKKTGDLFALSGSNWIEVRDLSFNGDGANLASYTSGCLVNFTGAGGEFTVRNVAFSHSYDGICFNNSTAADGRVLNANGGQMKDQYINFHAFGGGGFIDNVEVFGSLPAAAAEANSTCITIAEGDTYTLNNVNCAFTGFGVTLQPLAGKTLANVFATNVLADTTATGDGWTINGANGGAVLQRVYLTNSWGSTNKLSGLHAISVNDLHLVDFHAMTNQQRGVYIDANVTGLQILGGEFGGNSFLSSFSYDDIQIVAGTSDFSVQNTKIGAVAGLVQTSRNTLRIEDGPSDNYIITGNRLAAGGGGGGLYDGGTGNNKVVRDNVGQEDVIPTLASANRLYLGNGDNTTFFVTGTTTVKSIFQGTSGGVVCSGGNRKITLIPTGVFALGDGAGNIASPTIRTAANEPVVGVCDGTNWRFK